MKVFKLHAELDRQIKKAQKQDRVAQYQLYQKFSPKMLCVAKYYVKDLQFAEDILQKAFCKAFIGIKEYTFKGSFEGWLRRIVVRCSIDFLRQRKSVFAYADQVETVLLSENPLEDVQDLTHIHEAIDKLPDGYKTVFCLYVLEEYKHKEIAELLNIDVGTSKSQLYKARKILKEELKSYKLKTSR